MVATQRVVEAAKRSALTAGLVAFVASPRVRRRPYPGYRVLRRLDRVHASPLGICLLTGHAEANAALKNPRLGSDESKADESTLKFGVVSRILSRDDEPREGPFVDVFEKLMLFLDPPDHGRLRKLVAKAFTPRRTEALVPRIEALVDELLRPAARDGGMELMGDFAYPLPAQVICELLGVPPEDSPLIVAHAPALATGLDPSPMRTAAAVAAADTATTAIVSYLDGLIDRRRTDPGPDLLSALISAEEDGDRLSHDEVISTAVLLLIAGHETTANLIGNGMRALLRDREQFDHLRHHDDPALDKLMVEELLRFDSPVQMTQRIALEPIEIGDIQIPTGGYVILFLGAANHDPTVFERPQRLDLTRSPNPHLAFGAGAHHCIGAALARVEARIAIRALVRQFPAMHLAGPPPKWRPSFTIRGLEHLNLAW